MTYESQELQSARPQRITHNIPSAKRNNGTKSRGTVTLPEPSHVPQHFATGIFTPKAKASPLLGQAIANTLAVPSSTASAAQGAQEDHCDEATDADRGDWDKMLFLYDSHKSKNKETTKTKAEAQALKLQLAEMIHRQKARTVGKGRDGKFGALLAHIGMSRSTADRYAAMWINHLNPSKFSVGELLPPFNSLDELDNFAARFTKQITQRVHDQIALTTFLERLRVHAGSAIQLREAPNAGGVFPVHFQATLAR